MLGCRHCYNLSYESRNEPRLARFGGIGYPIKAERQFEDLYKQIKRWTYRGKPTKKARKSRAIENRLNAYGMTDWDAVLRGQTRKEV